MLVKRKGEEVRKMRKFVIGMAITVLLCTGIAQADILEVRDTTVDGSGTNVQDFGREKKQSRNYDY